LLHQAQHWTTDIGSYREGWEQQHLPIAFGVVDKEETDSWTWFLTQLRTVIGSGNKFGKYTIMSDRQKVCAPLLLTTTL
jgi:hypothetical protein